MSDVDRTKVYAGYLDRPLHDEQGSVFALPIGGNGRVEIHELPEIFEVIVTRQWSAADPGQIRYATESMSQFLARSLGGALAAMRWPG